MVPGRSHKGRREKSSFQHVQSPKRTWFLQEHYGKAGIPGQSSLYAVGCHGKVGNYTDKYAVGPLGARGRCVAKQQNKRSEKGESLA